MNEPIYFVMMLLFFLVLGKRLMILFKILIYLIQNKRLLKQFEYLDIYISYSTFIFMRLWFELVMTHVVHKKYDVQNCVIDEVPTIFSA